MIVPESFHAASEELPWADNWAGDPGIKLKLLMADIEGGRFVVRMLFAPGTQVFPHKHSGEIHAFTFAGEWRYLARQSQPQPRQAQELLPRTIGAAEQGTPRAAPSARSGLAFVVSTVVVGHCQPTLVFWVFSGSSSLRIGPVTLVTAFKSALLRMPCMLSQISRVPRIASAKANGTI